MNVSEDDHNETGYLVLCDIDGVIADCGHRLHFIQKTPADWDGFFEACDDDAPIARMIHFVRGLRRGFIIVYVTGRPERIRAKTEQWLLLNGLPKGRLFMRRDGDHRQDHIVKLEILQSYIPPKSEIAAVIEDRDQVVEMWRGQGLLCLQPKKGDY